MLPNSDNNVLKSELHPQSLDGEIEKPIDYGCNRPDIAPKLCYEVTNKCQDNISASPFVINENVHGLTKGISIPNTINNEAIASNQTPKNTFLTPKRNVKNLQNSEPFHHAYHVGRMLGKGGFGVVYEGTRIRDGLQVALKHILKSKITYFDQVWKMK